MFPDVFERSNSSLIQTSSRIGDQVVDEEVEDALEGFVEFQLVGGVGIKLLGFAVEALEDGHTFADLVEREKMRFIAVVEIGGVVGDFVGQVDELGLERRTLVQQVFG